MVENEFPLIVRNLIKAFKHETCQRIALFLIKNGKTSFNDLTNWTQLSSAGLNHFLRKMERYGAIYNYYIKNDFINEYRVVEISKLGRKFATILLNYVRIEKEDPYHPPCECGHGQDQHYDYIEEAYGECNECNCRCYKKVEK